MIDTSYILMVGRGRIGGLLLMMGGVGRRGLGCGCVHGSRGVGGIGASGRGDIVAAILVVRYGMRLVKGARWRVGSR